MKRANTILFLISIYLISFNACLQNDNENRERGDIISSNMINAYSIAEIRQLWSNLGIDHVIGLHYSVDAIRIVYQTVDVNGNSVQASGES